jgi:hypothetical protein
MLFQKMLPARICARTGDSISLIKQRNHKSHDYQIAVSEQMCVENYVEPLYKIGKRFPVGTILRVWSDVIAL